MSKAILKSYRLQFPWPTQDPFLFCAYHMDHYPPGGHNMGPEPAALLGRNLGNDFTLKEGWRMYHGRSVPGFPYHPHRGFETVTIAEQGFCDHSDSLGASGRFGQGDVQWMTAGSGVQHSEMFPLLHKEQDNPLELFQIWLNLPKAKKLVDPHFRMLWNTKIPRYQKDGVVVKVIAGCFEGVRALESAPDSWAADSKNEVAIWLITLPRQHSFTLPKATQNVNRSLYCYKGYPKEIDGLIIKEPVGLALDASRTVVITTGAEEAHMLLLQGKPIDEPIAQHGPFVMNTYKEIDQAISDYQLTKFGGWPWPYPDQVHDREKGRFAIYPNGQLEQP
ncbi:MAG: pirin family protein [Bacteroidota bacterium]